MTANGIEDQVVPGWRRQARDGVRSRGFQFLATGMTLLAVFTGPVVFALWHALETPEWAIAPGQIVLFFELFTTAFFIIESALFLAAYGRAWLRRPMATINALVVIFTGASFFAEDLGLANPRILRLLRQVKGAARVGLTQRSRLPEGVLGAEALARLNFDDTWQALIVLLIFSFGTAFGAQDYHSLDAALRDILLYLGIGILMKWKQMRNERQIHDVFVERMNNATRLVAERMRTIPGLEQSAERLEAGEAPESGQRSGNEISNLVDSVLLIISRLRRFISRRTFREARGEVVLPPDQPVALWFSDVEHFSNMTRVMGPDIIGPLKVYFGAMNAELAAHGGDIDKFIGDAVFAFFHQGEGSDPDSDARRALDAALAVARRIESLAADPVWNALFCPEHQPFVHFRTRIGLHLGTVVAGPIGSDDRADSTLIGDAVNIAARLEPLNKLYGTRALMSEAFAAALDPARRAHCRKIDRVTVAGREEDPFDLYCLDETPWPPALHALFEAAVAAYLNGDFDAARLSLHRLAEQGWGEDGPSQTLLRRLEQDTRWQTGFCGYWAHSK